MVGYMHRKFNKWTDENFPEKEFREKVEKYTDKESKLVDVVGLGEYFNVPTYVINKFGRKLGLFKWGKH